MKSTLFPKYQVMLSRGIALCTGHENLPQTIVDAFPQYDLIPIPGCPHGSMH